jgi:arylsulfatase
MKRARFVLAIAAAALVSGWLLAPVHAEAEQKPNIVIIWGDDIGQSDLSTYTFGVMGFQTPNIDRVAAEGVQFTLA